MIRGPGEPLEAAAMKVSRVELHKDAKLLSLEQRIQLYTLMFKVSKRGISSKITNQTSRNQQK